MVNVLEITSINEKLRNIEAYVHSLLTTPQAQFVPLKPGRDIPVLLPQYHPDKKGFASAEGRGRLMHDLASIELQAMELGLRTLMEFPEAPSMFRQQLADVVISEAKHLQLCLSSLGQSGFQWGHWPVHTALWDSVSAEDDLLDRIFIVHRYLEGSGLDAGDTLLRRLKGMSETEEQRTLQIIHDEEVGHVAFGSKWFRTICEERKLDPDHKLREQIQRLRNVLPKRIEKIAIEPRRKAGFTDGELQTLEELRQSYLTKDPERLRPDRRNATALEATFPV